MKKQSKRLRSSLEEQDRRRKLREKTTRQMNRERASFEEQANLPFRIGDGEWLKLRYDGYTKCVIVYFDERLSYAEISSRMKKGFGDLDGREAHTQL